LSDQTSFQNALTDWLSIHHLIVLTGIVSYLADEERSRVRVRDGHGGDREAHETRVREAPEQRLLLQAAGGDRRTTTRTFDTISPRLLALNNITPDSWH